MYWPSLHRQAAALEVPVGRLQASIAKRTGRIKRGGVRDPHRVVDAIQAGRSVRVGRQRPRLSEGDAAAVLTVRRPIAFAATVPLVSPRRQ